MHLASSMPGDSETVQSMQLPGACRQSRQEVHDCLPSCHFLAFSRLHAEQRGIDTADLNRQFIS